MIQRWPGIEYAALVTPHEYHIEVALYRITGYLSDDDSVPCFHRKGAHSYPDDVEDVTDAECFMMGSIKWDGCSNWKMQDPCFHECSRKGLEQIGEVLTLCWDMTKTLCPHWDKSIAE